MSYLNGNKVFYIFNIPVSISKAIYIPNISFKSPKMGQHLSNEIDQKSIPEL